MICKGTFHTGLLQRHFCVQYKAWFSTKGNAAVIHSSQTKLLDQFPLYKIQLVLGASSVPAKELVFHSTLSIRVAVWPARSKGMWVSHSVLDSAFFRNQSFAFLGAQHSYWKQLCPLNFMWALNSHPFPCRPTIYFHNNFLGISAYGFPLVCQIFLQSIRKNRLLSHHFQ